MVTCIIEQPKIMPILQEDKKYNQDRQKYYLREKHTQIHKLWLKHHKMHMKKDYSQKVIGKLELLKKYMETITLYSTSQYQRRKQLGQILELIKQEKAKIYETMKNLQIASTYYKSMVDAKNLCRQDAAVNTEPQPYNTQQHQYGIQTQTIQTQMIQTQNCSPTSQNTSKSSSPSQLQKAEQIKSKQPLAKQQQAQKQLQTYQKLAELLSEMKINYRLILPDNINVKVDVVEGKQLTEKETIKIQKYLIKKLAQKTSL